MKQPSVLTNLAMQLAIVRARPRTNGSPIFRITVGAVCAAIGVVMAFSEFESSTAAQTAVFSRPTDTIQIPGSSNVIAQATYEAWVRASGVGVSRIWNEWKSGSKDTALGLNPGNQPSGFSWPLNSALGILVGTGSGIPADTWFHAAYVYDGATEHIYVNGTLVATRAGSGPIANTGTPVGAVGAIFRDGRINYTIPFEIDSLRISGVARYSGATFTPPPSDMSSDANTLLLFDFNEGAGSLIVIDHSPLHRNGVLGVGFTGATSPDLCRSGDIDCSGSVNIDDLVAVITSWGSCSPPCPPHCPADVNHDCAVNIDDLVAVITHWG